MVLIILIFLLVTPILWYILPPSINSFLPEYVQVIDASKWMVIAGFMGLFSILGIFYNVINVQKKRLFMYLSGVIGWLMVLTAAYGLNKISLELFPQALFVGYLIMTIINIYFIKNNWFKTQASY